MRDVATIFLLYTAHVFSRSVSFLSLLNYSFGARRALGLGALGVKGPWYREPPEPCPATPVHVYCVDAVATCIGATA